MWGKRAPGQVVLSVLSTFWQLCRTYIRRRGNFYAKAMAFSFLLTFIPIVMVLLWGVSMLLSRNVELQNVFISQLVEMVPPAASEFVQERIYEIIRSRSWRNLGIFGIVILIWAPNSLFSTLIHGLRVMMQVDEPAHSPWVRHLFTFTVHYLVAFLVVLFSLISMVLNSFLPVDSLPPILEGVQSYWVTTMVLFLTLASLYLMSYGEGLSWRILALVSFALAVLWHVFHFLGARIISSSGEAEVFYGIFAGVAVVMTWSLLFSAAILFGGLCIASMSSSEEAGPERKYNL
ncbi:YihY/virulence factor BrkB family protein [Chitinivibrio alkaliphilus]|uniref:Uncharacterized protein n=1 Tax=Chitinivibrio alkaliphilus ACht1 TaxID=1313304 RepID=U7DAS4_9BACT|nr:YihY/virulence factor BrkB family protein [Chitinivibrio alkaliphilus]ERP38673.1 hypothetical protein CALK_0689 [Chitinivibrio alkaliphilus ACht1]